MTRSAAIHAPGNMPAAEVVEQHFADSRARIYERLPSDTAGLAIDRIHAFAVKLGMRGALHARWSAAMPLTVQA